MRRENGRIWNRLQSDEKPRQDQLQELRNEVKYIDLMFGKYVCHTFPNESFNLCQQIKNKIKLYVILQSLFVLKNIQTLAHIFT